MSRASDIALSPCGRFIVSRLFDKVAEGQAPRKRTFKEKR